jgi:hypothetical protein
MTSTSRVEGQNKKRMRENTNDEMEIGGKIAKTDI